MYHALSGMNDVDKLRAAPFIIDTDAEAEWLRKLWGQYVDGEIEEEDWEREWQCWLSQPQGNESRSTERVATARP